MAKAIKSKSVWYCKECGHKQMKWLGQCPLCFEWNSFEEEIESTAKPRYDSEKSSKPVRLHEIKQVESKRIHTDMSEINRLFGGGIQVGSLSLIGGHPGIGKSTLMLQLAKSFAKEQLVLYVCGEESIEQTSSRAQRLNVKSEQLFLLSETNLDVIKQHVEAINPSILIIDSIQIIYKPHIGSSAGSVTQVRECTAELMHLSKGKCITTFLVGHVTKGGEIAGPKVLEHLVDTVLYFEGEKQSHLRIIRGVKNRFGPTDEIALFQMIASGLEEVKNPSKVFLEGRDLNQPGSSVIPTLEGSRPILIEVQALVTPTFFPTPSRRSAGLDQNRLALLLAVLEKRMRFPLHKNDVFVSLAGGLKITEPGIDLGVLLAIASSMQNRQIKKNTVVIGEVGLGGEIRCVTRIEGRLKEAASLGFECCLIPQNNLKNPPKNIEVIEVRHVEEAVNQCLK